MNKNLLYDGLLLAAVAILALAVYRLAPHLAPHSDVALPLSECDLNRGPCRALLPDELVIEFSIEPRPIPVVKPLQLQMTSSRPIVQRAEVDFAGVTMQMGYNRVKLRQPPDGSGFVGQGDLPVCVTGAMQWQATLIVETEQKTLAIPFRFVSGH